MITNHKYQTRLYKHNNWTFLPTAFSALAGVGLGLIIGNCLGWL
ncbi:hypothetical protein [Pleurocapsa sp. FMAR1]|nr:hypothetical protein [Pleurocapsa sp. FMAR1]